MSEKRTGTALAALTLLAAAALSIYLVHVHTLAVEGQRLGALCDMSTRVNCRGAATSRWASIGGVPIALIGLGWYVAAAFLLVIGDRATASGSRGARGVLFVGAVFGAAYSVFLAFVAVFAVGSVCPGCAGLYLCNALLLWFAWRWSGGWRGAMEGLRTDRGYRALALAAVVQAVVVAVGMRFAPEHVAPVPAAVLEGSAEQDLHTDGAPAVGPIDAPVLIVEFSDFQCPYCSRLAANLHEVVERFGDAVRIEFRHFPLDFHEHAFGAAVAGVCAAEQGKFWPMHDAMFANQRSLDRTSLFGLARDAGLDPDALEACMDAGSADERVSADREAGRALGVTGTPSWVVNGRMYVGAHPTEDIAAIVESVLAADDGAAPAGDADRPR